MKQVMILSSFLALFGCKTGAQKLHVSTIYTQPQRVTREIPGTDSTHTFTTRRAVTERLSPGVFMLSKNDEALQFRIRGNISSSGHSIHQVRKIRLEKGEQNGNSITLKYYVEIKKISGKENANVQGYNYVKDVVYKIPNDIKLIKVELYEEQNNDRSETSPKLITQQTFNFFAKI